jgi:hypothetical protein
MNEWTGQQSVTNVGGATDAPPANPTTAATAQLQTPLPEPAPLGQRNEGGYQPRAVTPHNGAANKPLWNERSDGLTVVAGYHFVVAALCLLGTLIMMIPTGILGIVSVVEDSDAVIAMFIVGTIAIFTLGLSLLYLAVGYGLWTLKPWGRVAALALAVVSLFGFPIGTIPGGLTLWYLMRPEVSAKFEQPQGI